MQEKNIKSKSYLVFKRKDISFEVPDDFPEENIPTFINEDDFKKWYKNQGFKNLTVENNFEDKEGVIGLRAEDESLKDTKARIKPLNILLKDLEKHDNLLKEEGTLPAALFALYPENFIKVIASKYLPKNAYEKLKSNLQNKFPEESFQSLCDQFINSNIIQHASETFVTFLMDEKITLKPINFYELDFDYIGTFDEKQDDWDVAYEENPFTLSKMEYLWNMCDQQFNEKKNTNELIKKILLIMKTKQKNKLILLLKLKIVPRKSIQLILEKEKKNFDAEYRSLLINSLKDSL
jgi:hypothetical protein